VRYGPELNHALLLLHISLNGLELKDSMKTITALMMLVLLGGTVATAQWKKRDERAPDSPDRKSVNGFGANLLIVKDPRGFIEEWQKPKTPKIDPVSEVKRGELLGAFVLFAGCKPDTQGRCNSEVDYTVYNPHGSIYAERKEQPLWKEEAPPGTNIQLGRAILAIRMEENDPVGDYRVKAKVADLNAQISFALETKFRLR
jgi:hypothetical protein